MEELVDAVLAGVDAAKAQGHRKYMYILRGDGDIIVLEGLVQERLPGHSVNHMTIRHFNGHVEKRLVIDW